MRPREARHQDTIMPPEKLTLSIRNMVCDRCVRVVREELGKLGLEIHHVELGGAVVAAGSSLVDVDRIAATLSENGFELIRDKRKKTIEDIRHAIIGLLHRDEPVPDGFRLSRYVSDSVGEEYGTLSSLFSSVEGVTIEHFFILQKIERVKELIKYGEKPLKEIAWELGYSSTQHLSNQFKQVTGMTPTQFRSLDRNSRISLDRVRG